MESATVPFVIMPDAGAKRDLYQFSFLKILLRMPVFLKELKCYRDFCFGHSLFSYIDRMTIMDIITNKEVCM